MGPCTLPEECIDMCICPTGYVENENQTCIPIKDCICTDEDGNKYLPGKPVETEKKCHEWLVNQMPI